jgi:hypothetical protein
MDIYTSETLTAGTTGDFIEPQNVTLAAAVVALSLKVTPAAETTGEAEIFVVLKPNPFADSPTANDFTQAQTAAISVVIPKGRTDAVQTVTEAFVPRSLEQVAYIVAKGNAGVSLDVDCAVESITEEAAE